MRKINGRQRYVHRWVYSRLHGGFRGIYGKVVLHLCDNRACYRYDHLYLGTPHDNSRDMVGKGRSARGTQIGVSKLTADQAREIRRRCLAGEAARSLGREFGVAHNTICNIAHMKTWAHV